MNTRFIPFSLDETSMESLSIIYNPQKEIQKQKTIRASKLKQKSDQTCISPFDSLVVHFAIKRC